MFYLTAVKDITKALEAFCVSLNQLIRPLVSWKKKQLIFESITSKQLFQLTESLPFFSQSITHVNVNFDCFYPQQTMTEVGCLFAKTAQGKDTRESALCVTLQLQNLFDQ